MKSNILKKMKFLVVLFVTIFSITAIAQDINQAGEIFNEGNQAIKDANYKLAIQKYEKSIEIASSLGAEGEQILNGAKATIPSCYYKMGIADYKAKDYDKAIKEMDNAVTYGVEYGDPETVKKAGNIIPKLHYARGLNFYKAENWDQAINDFNKAIELNPNYSKPYRLLGIVYSETGDMDKMMESFSTGLQVSEKVGDSETAEKIKSAARKKLQPAGATKLQAQNWVEALKYFNELLRYDPQSKDTYYYVAVANNGLKKWDEAIKSSQKGLEISSGDSDDYKAKFYYEMGNAYKGIGKNSEACEAFSNAKFGSFAAGADYELKEVLKCN
nr:tetratricopeptide repeat protein [Bacteroidota bacterium]